jgi:hypothetical protein
MSASQELSDLFRQWQLLTEEEGAAITVGAWSQVEHYQSAKARLQPRITEVSQRLDAKTLEEQFRSVINDLMEMERRNDAFLQEKRQSAKEQEHTLDRTQRNLRQIQKSYVPPSRTHWQSYS